MIEKQYFQERITSHDNHTLILHHWPVKNPNVIIHLIHGMSEHAFRYNEFGKWLNQKQIYAYSLDLRGHGKTAKNIDSIGLFSVRMGWDKVVLDIEFTTKKLGSQFKEVPNVILGHSMGSFLARSVAIKFPNLVNHYIYSATGSHPGVIGYFGGFIAHINCVLFGKETRSKFLQFLVMGDFNKKIKNPRTKKDWVSRDNNVVDNYVNDPFCMQIFKNQFFVDLAYGVMKVTRKNAINNENKNKDILFIGGDMDPVGNYGKGLKKVFHYYKINGFSNIELKLFHGGRHEMLNEINKEEVYNYIYNWILKNILNGK